ncbi:MAG TPA: hypothetical protein VHN98_05120 [Acidimicrobiales bacterium]|nr:hypothetical protein [Acidimicrobiales bacterium]
MTRLLVLMGSGETSPTMVKTHREVLARFGRSPAAVLLDTPYGFQSNADELSARAVAYFADSVGADLRVARYRSAAEIGSVGYESALAQIRAADFVFSGPGSPTYALRQWRGSGVPDLLIDKLRAGGCVTFASAAALTLGVATVPVYEIYKVGSDPEWEDGLDLVGEAGLRCAVIPHYNNAEGGTHDTRFCYLGEQRLEVMEEALPADCFVLGVDEHTGCVLDLDERTATIVGIGTLTVRAAGRSEVFETGSVLAIEEIVATAARLRAGTGGHTTGAAFGTAGEAGTPGESARRDAGAAGDSVLLAAVTEQEAAFADAVAARDAEGAVQAILDVEAEIHAWSADTNQSDEVDRARATLRSMIVRLGQLAEVGARDPRDVVGPYVESLLAMRSAARADRRFADADAVRDRLVELGVEVRDTPEGTSWNLT